MHSKVPLIAEGASQVEKSPRLNWATQFLTVAYDGACSLNVCVRMAWISFWRLTLQEKKKTWWQLASPCCWNRTRRLTCFLLASVTRRDLQFGTWTDPLSKDTIDSVLRHLEVGRTKDLRSAPRVCMYTHIYIRILLNIYNILYIFQLYIYIIYTLCILRLKTISF